MYIAICDDNVQNLNIIEDMISRYASDHDLLIRYKSFSNPEEMLIAAQSERFTHYFLDVVMPGMDGITAAQEIRSGDPEAIFVFLTSFQEYAYQSYSVKAYDYLLKPLDETKMFSLLAELAAHENPPAAYMCIRSGRSLFRVSFAHLAYLEVNRKRLYFQMTDGRVLEVPGTLAEIEGELLSRREFIKIHRSYIVNLNHVSALSQNSCIMQSGKDIPISRLLYDQVHKRYISHLFGCTEG